MESPTHIALSRQLGLRRALDIVANNLANVNTPSYKAERMMFVEHLARPQRDLPMSFVQDIGLVRDLRDGPLTQTNNPLDLAIMGEGYFTVETEAGPRYTRAGRFQMNAERQIVNTQGHPVLSANGGPILIPEDGIEITIAPDGTVSAGAEAVDRIGVVTFENHRELSREGSGYFTTDEVPREAEDTRVMQGMLEESNVNAVIEITKLIEIHRTYAANQQLLQDEHERARRAISRLVAPPNT